MDPDSKSNVTLFSLSAQHFSWELPGGRISFNPPKEPVLYVKSDTSSLHRRSEAWMIALPLANHAKMPQINAPRRDSVNGGHPNLRVRAR